MSDDDSMMLNFSAPVAGSGIKKKKKSRRELWKESREAERNSSKSSTGANSMPVAHRERRPNRDEERSSGDKRPVINDRSVRGNKKLKYDRETGGLQGGKDGSYVSSLFTAAPDIKQRDYDQQVGDLRPSNAPVLDKDADFKALGVNEALCKALSTKLSFEKPTEIQRAVIPALLHDDKDLFVQAQTGSGKTLAFTLPIVQKLMNASDGSLNRQSGLFAIILAPTRELATQTYEFIATKLCSACHWIVPGIVIGGEKKKAEKARIRKGVNILVGTPGRLADHIENTGNLDLSKVRYLVLDEGDRLMDLGFEEAINQLLDNLQQSFNPYLPDNLRGSLPSKRVNILCSATMKGNVKKLGEISLKDAKLVTADSIASQDMKAPEQLVEEVLVVPPKLRYVTLAATLKNMTHNRSVMAKTIVFFSCADSVDFHFIAMTREGKHVPEKEVSAFSAPLITENSIIYKLHGSMSQVSRTATLSHFSKDVSRHAILFCTDVASRGLDMPDIKNVVEYDPPFTLEDHVHRVGRTARAGSSGFSVLFLLPGEEENYISRIEPLHDKKNLRFMNFEDVMKKAFGQSAEEEAADGKPRGMREGSWDIFATTYQLNMERWLLESPRAKEMATKAFISHTRAYTTHLAAERDCFNMKKLHLGHLAKSFGLRETPKALASQGSKAHEKKKEDSKTKMLRLANKAASAQSDEFNIA